MWEIKTAVPARVPLHKMLSIANKMNFRVTGTLLIAKTERRSLCSDCITHWMFLEMWSNSRHVQGLIFSPKTPGWSWDLSLLLFSDNRRPPPNTKATGAGSSPIIPT